MTGLDFVSLGLILMSVVIITLGIIKIHTYPGVIARERKHPQVDAIEVTSLLGLLIFPFWMGALIWAYSGALFGRLYVQQSPDVETDVETAVDTENQTDDKA
jgi:hypothetical protein